MNNRGKTGEAGAVFRDTV